MRKLKYFCVKAGGTPLPFERFLFVIRSLFETSLPVILEVLWISIKTDTDSWDRSDFSKVKLHMTTQKNTNKNHCITWKTSILNSQCLSHSSDTMELIKLPKGNNSLPSPARKVPLHTGNWKVGTSEIQILETVKGLRYGQVPLCPNSQ